MFIRTKVQDYLALSKHKLSLIVVITSLCGYLFAGGSLFSLSSLLLFIGGFLVTASANTINQILEKEYDAMMKRTKSRPLPQGRMSDFEAWLFAGASGILGIILLWITFNANAALLAALSILSYAFFYTPMKRIHPIAVFIGAFPGALPPLIGYVAFANQFNIEAFLFFTIQFLWQFPHFWAIGWLGFDDYKKAGYKLLPSGEKDASVPVQSIIFVFMLILVSVLPYVLGVTSLLSSIICVIASTVYLVPAVQLLESESDKDAKSLMFVSFAYLPIVFTALILG